MYSSDRQNFHIYLPESFDPTTITPKYRQPAAYLLGLITSKWDERDKGDWVRLKALYLRHTVGRDAELVRDELAAKNVIQVHRQYVKGKQSFGFRLHPQHAVSPYIKVHLTDAALVARVRKGSVGNGPDDSCPLQVGLWHWLGQLRIDRTRALACVLGAVDRGSLWRNGRLMAIDGIEQGFWLFTRDSYGRIHTNFSMLWRELRRCCSLACSGEALVNLDIVNSQPLFLFLSLKEQYLKLTSINNNNIYTLHRTSYDAQHRDSNTQAPGLPTDLHDYAKAVEGGTFYESLMTATATKKTRHQFKKSLYANILFSTRQFKSQEKAAFQTAYPTASALLDAMKAKEPRTAAWNLQRAESNFILDTCCRRLLLEWPETPLLTIHDSITTTESHVDRVRAVMVEEFSKIGLEPTIADSRAG